MTRQHTYLTKNFRTDDALRKSRVKVDMEMYYFGFIIAIEIFVLGR